MTAILIPLALALAIALNPGSASSAFAQADRYTFYGGEIQSEAKNSAVEECEYRELVENQRCNERLNKSVCIEEIHAECRRNYGDSGMNTGNNETKPKNTEDEAPSTNPR